LRSKPAAAKLAKHERTENLKGRKSGDIANMLPSAEGDPNAFVAILFSARSKGCSAAIQHISFYSMHWLKRVSSLKAAAQISVIVYCILL
jgi:hypothetical protein